MLEELPAGAMTRVVKIALSRLTRSSTASSESAVATACAPSADRLDALFRVLERMREAAGEVPLAVVLIPAEFAVELGLAAGAGSDAHVPDAIGAAYVEMPDFDGPDDFLVALRAGRVAGHHWDEPRRWAPRIVPSTTSA